MSKLGALIETASSREVVRYTRSPRFKFEVFVVVRLWRPFRRIMKRLFVCSFKGHQLIQPISMKRIKIGKWCKVCSKDL